MHSPLAPAVRPMTLMDELDTEARSAFYVGLIEGKYGAPAGFAVTALSSLRDRAASRLAPDGLQSTGAAMLERCDYCGCSVHACGCEERFEYEDIRDNPTLFAR